MDREWREPIAEFTASVSEGMRLCLGVAEDLKVAALRRPCSDSESCTQSVISVGE